MLDSTASRVTETPGIAPGHGDLTFTASRKKAMLLLFGSLCFVALGVWIVPQKPLLGWSCVAFFGLGVPTSVFMILPGAMYLKLDTEGFELGSFFRKHKTKWTDVERFEVRAIHTTKIITVVYSQAYQEQKLARAISSSLAGAEGGLPNSYNASLDQIVTALNDWKSRFGRTDA